MIEVHKLKNSRVAIIDGDSIAFLVGWNHKEHDEVQLVLDHVDDLIHSILQATQCSYHVGLLNPKDTAERKVANFRETIAVTKPYKGTRPDKPEWYLKWAQYIENHLIEHWKFMRVPYDMEADDMVCSLMAQLRAYDTCTPICCGEDKDLNQIPGDHYNFKKNVGWHISYNQAVRDFYYQVLMGDTSDNIPGLAGCGKVGAAVIVDSPDLDSVNMHVGTLYAFTNKLGVDKGIQSFYENYMLCKLRTDLPTDLCSLTAYDLNAGAVREFKPREEEIEELPAFDAGLFSAE